MVFSQQAGNVHKMLPKIVEFETCEDMLNSVERLEKVCTPLFDIYSFKMFSVLVHTKWLGDLFGVRGVQRVYPNPPMFLNFFPFPPLPKLPFLAETPMQMNPLNRVYTRGKQNFIPTTESMKIIEVDKAHQAEIKGAGVKLAVIDTGCNNLNPMFQGEVSEEFAFPSIGDTQGHGTWCCGCAFGNDVIDNYTNLELIGMAPDSEKISVKVFPDLMPFTSTDIILKGIEVALVNRGAKVLSMSLGGEDCGEKDCAYGDVLHQLNQKGIITVIAAGNSGPNSNTIGCPGCHEKALTIGAISIKGDIAEFSSRGPTKVGRIKPDCVAPGGASQFDEYVHSACSGTSDGFPDGAPTGFESMMGTSMSTPHVAGLIALWVQRARQKDIELNLETVMRIIAENGEPKTNISGHGIIKYSWIENFLRV